MGACDVISPTEHSDLGTRGNNHMRTRQSLRVSEIRNSSELSMRTSMLRFRRDHMRAGRREGQRPQERGLNQGKDLCQVCQRSGGGEVTISEPARAGIRVTHGNPVSDIRGGGMGKSVSDSGSEYGG